MDRAIRALSTGISMSIAVTAETIADRKDRKTQKSPVTVTVTSLTPSTYISSLSIENRSIEQYDQTYLDAGGPLAVDWELDETANNPGESTGLEANEQEDSVTEDQVSQMFIDNHQAALQPGFPTRHIPQMVLLPQRRPRDRTRGFIRAYPPILGEYSGIDQNTFIDFLNDFDRASKVSPIFNVINAACFGVGFIPSSIAIAVSTCVSVANEAAKEFQGRHRTNKFLHKMNEVLFKPHRLFAMVMTYRPDMPNDTVLEASMANPTAIAAYKSLSVDSNIIKEKLKSFRSSAGVAHNDTSIPDPAPLIYPSLDKLLDSTTNTSRELQTSPAGKYSAVQSYLDRRAQAKYASENRNSKLAMSLPPAEKSFACRYSDPNHRVNSGSIFGVLSGGIFDPIAAGRVRRAKATAMVKGEPKLTAEELHDAYMGRGIRGRRGQHDPLPVVGRLLQKNVLYLVIVNLPSEAELAELGSMLNQRK